MNPVLGRCPVCHDELTVTRLRCPTCSTTLDGSFTLGRLQRLDQAQLQFIEAFIRCRGSMKDVGSELNISYPTVNNRLNEVLMALGYGDRVKIPEEQAAGGVSADRRREILTQLRSGEITATEAERQLRGQA